MTRNRWLCFLSPILPACFTRAKLSTPLFTLTALLAAAAFSPHAAQAQCSTFASGTAASLSLNITNLPTPSSTAWSGGGGGTGTGTEYTYNLAGLTGNSATYISGSTSNTSTSFTTFSIQIAAANSAVRGGGRWGHYGGTSGAHTANARWR